MEGDRGLRTEWKKLLLGPQSSSLFQSVRADGVAGEQPLASALQEREALGGAAALEAGRVEEFEGVAGERHGGALLLGALRQRAALDATQALAHAPEDARALLGRDLRAPLRGGLPVDLLVAPGGDVLGHALDGRLRRGRHVAPLVHGTGGEQKK